MTDANTLATFQAVQRVMADVTGMKVVHGVTAPTSGDGVNALIRPQTELLDELPALVLGAGSIEIIPGPVTRLTWTINAAVYRSRQELRENYDLLVGDVGRIVTAVQARGKAYAIQAGLQSLRLMSFGAIDGLEWPQGTNRFYLVLPFELQVVADFDTPIVPA